MTLSLCRICGGADLEELAEFGALQRVTSDCRPWPSGGRLAVCRSCGVLQKPLDDRWDVDCRSIYADYLLYPQGGGAEQAVFDQISGASSGRSDRLIERIHAVKPLAASGRILDVGCGNGAFLRAFHARAPGWKLNGTELHDRYRKEIEAIAGMEAFHQCFPEEVAGEFDWIVFLHVLEHVPAPVALLDRLRPKFRPAGLLVVDLPDHRQNPFDLVVADHACHFSTETLRMVIERAGYSVDYLARDWIPRELTALARVGKASGKSASLALATVTGARSALRWLATMAEQARSSALAGPIGVFGSSIAATWLMAEMGDRVAFFVDEDPHRDGRSHCSRPIFSPDRVPLKVPIYVALPPAQALAVQERLRARGFEVLAPPVWLVESG